MCLRKHVGGQGLSFHVPASPENGHGGRSPSQRFLRVDRAVGDLGPNEIEPTLLHARASLQHALPGFNPRDRRIELAVIGEGHGELSVEARLNLGLRGDLQGLVELHGESEKVAHPSVHIAEALQQSEPFPRCLGEADGVGEVIRASCVESGLPRAGGHLVELAGSELGIGLARRRREKRQKEFPNRIVNLEPPVSHGPENASVR